MGEALGVHGRGRADRSVPVLRLPSQVRMGQFCPIVFGPAAGRCLRGASAPPGGLCTPPLRAIRKVSFLLAQLSRKQVLTACELEFHQEKVHEISCPGRSVLAASRSWDM